MQEFVAAAKASPGKLRVGSPGEGTSSHLNLEELKRLAGVNFTHVPFSGWGESSPALLGGHIEGVVGPAGRGEAAGRGQARCACSWCSRPSATRPSPTRPTAKELGWDAASGVSFMFVAPKGTPGPVLKYIHDATRRRWRSRSSSP